MPAKNVLSNLWRRFRALRHPDETHAELSEEFQFHMDMASADLMLRGMPEAQARKAAARKFGSALRIQEQGNDVRGSGRAGEAWNDARFALRILRKNPSKTVLIPDVRAGCSLAESITGADVRALRAQYPGVPIITYVNTSAEVKAESDICCTSGNAVKVVESLGVPRVIMLPDRYLAQNVAAETPVEIIAWAGQCEVHERFSAADIATLRQSHPGVIVLAHPECPREVVEAADFAGSTAAMVGYVGTHRPARVALVTECSMADNVSVDYPDIEFVRPCNLCPHMKRITLPKIRHALETMSHAVTIPDSLAARARRSVERMIAIG